MTTIEPTMTEARPTDPDHPTEQTQTQIPGMTTQQSEKYDPDTFPNTIEPVGALDCYTMVMYLPKGGVGKSTTAAGIARASPAPGRRTLVIGLAGLQTEAADQFGIDFHAWDDNVMPNVATIFNREVRGGVVDLLGGKDEFVDALIHEGRGNVDVIPAHQHLDGLENTLPSSYPDATDRYSILDDFLTDFGVRERYDVIILDPPGAPGEITSNALWAGQNVVAPVTQGDFEAGQVESLLFELQNIRKHGRDVRLVSILPNQFDPETKQAQRLIRMYRRRYRDLLAPGVIPASQDISDAQGAGKTVFDLDEFGDPAHRALDTYPILASDLLARIELESFWSTNQGGDDR